MGWGSGSELAEDLWLQLRRYIPDRHKEAAAHIFIDSFEAYDSDTLEDCEVLMKDAGRE